MDLLTVQQVAIRLQVHPETILRWLRRNQLQGLKVGKQWRIKQDQLQTFLDKGEAAH